jgi:hypothetical protein
MARHASRFCRLSAAQLPLCLLAVSSPPRPPSFPGNQHHSPSIPTRCRHAHVLLLPSGSINCAVRCCLCYSVLDLDAVVQATQQLSSILKLDDLLSSLMDLIVTNTGATQVPCAEIIFCLITQQHTDVTMYSARALYCLWKTSRKKAAAVR